VCHFHCARRRRREAPNLSTRKSASIRLLRLAPKVHRRCTRDVQASACLHERTPSAKEKRTPSAMRREEAVCARDRLCVSREKRLRRMRFGDKRDSVQGGLSRNSAHLFSFALHRISLVTEGDTHRRSLENSSLRLACVAGSLFERPPSASEGGLSKRDSVHRLCTFGARRRRCTGGLSASERFQAKTTMTTQVSSEDNRNRTKKPKTRNPFQTISI